MTLILFASYRANADPPESAFGFFIWLLDFFVEGFKVEWFWIFENLNLSMNFEPFFIFESKKNQFFVVFLQSVHFEASCDHFKVIIRKPESYWSQKMQQQCVWDISDKILTTRNALVAFTKKLFWRVSKTCPPLIFEKTHFSSFSCNLFTLKCRVIISKLSFESLLEVDNKF